MTKINTQDKIITAAQKFFVKKGFAGTSINDIANDAKINKSLIYHHFGSKENLWKEVKLKLFGQYSQTEAIEFPNPLTLRIFLEKLITHRFKFYANNPQLVQMIHWQSIESFDESNNKAKLQTTYPWIAKIKTLQDQGEIRSDLQPDYVMLFIAHAASAPFIVPSLLLNTKDAQQQYFNMVVDCLYRGLTP
jgi:AcrR family transcriptional regulator